MSDERIVGAARNISGKVQEGVGTLTGDSKAQAEGMANQAFGVVEDLYGQAKDVASQAADGVNEGASQAADYVAKLVKERPYTVAVGSFFLGLIIAHTIAHRDDYSRF